MALRFIDSFDHYTTNDLQALGSGMKWSGFGTNSSNPPVNSPTIISGGRFGNCASFFPSGNTCYLYKILDNQATWVVGFVFKITTLNGQQILSFRDSGTLQVDLRINSSGQLFVTRGNTTVATSTNVISINTWYYVEYKVTFSASISANTWEVNVNGVNWINVAATTNSKNTANSFANGIYLGSIDLTSSGTWYYDDLYICDGTGSTNKDFLGDCRVECRFPSGPSGTNTNWLASSGTTTGCINENAPNADTSYIYSATTNDISTFTLPPISSTPVSIFGTQLTYFARKTDAGIRQITDAVRSGSTNYVGTTVSLSNTYSCFSNIYETDPNTSAAWITTGVNNLEIGVKEIT